MNRLDDPELVRREYESERGLTTRASVYRGSQGHDGLEVAFEAVREVEPALVLEVGCGWGEFAARMCAELGAKVVAIDQSERMVELARARGVDARVGDVQALPFDDGEFDCAVANWMLYHVPDVDRALCELARVLRPGGRLVAGTNGRRHLEELWSLVGRHRDQEPIRFLAEDGEDALRPHFARVERRDSFGPVEFENRDAVRAYIASLVTHKHLADRVPSFDGPLRATRVNAVFIAEKAS